MLNLGPTINPRQAANLAAFMAAFAFVPGFVVRTLLVGFDWRFACAAAVSLIAALVVKLDWNALMTAMLLGAGWFGVMASARYYLGPSGTPTGFYDPPFGWAGVVACLLVLLLAGHIRLKSAKDKRRDAI